MSEGEKWLREIRLRKGLGAAETMINILVEDLRGRRI